MIWLLLACFSSGGSGDCHSLSDGEKREDCLFQEVQKFSGDQVSIRIYIDGITEKKTGNKQAIYSRDLLRFRLASSDPVRYQWICQEAETTAGKEKCRQILGRPHMTQDKKRR